jgi:hypothetical protein
MARLPLRQLYIRSDTGDVSGYTEVLPDSGNMGSGRTEQRPEPIDCLVLSSLESWREPVRIFGVLS